MFEQLRERIKRAVQKAIDKLRGKNPEPEPISLPPVEEIKPPQQPEPTPEPISDPTPQPPPVNPMRCIWDPSGSSVAVTVQVAHWQFALAYPSPSVHHHHGLHGPIRGSARVWTLQGSGEHWRNQSLAMDPAGRGAVVVFVNTNRPTPAGWTAASMRVPDPRVRFEGVMT